MKTISLTATLVGSLLAISPDSAYAHHNYAYGNYVSTSATGYKQPPDFLVRKKDLADNATPRRLWTGRALFDHTAIGRPRYTKPERGR